MRWVLNVLGLFFVAGSLWAEVPQEMHYQGYLTNAVGDPVDCPDPLQCDESINITFRLYEGPDSDTSLWVETHVGVSIYQGVFHLKVGSETLLNSESLANARWMGISINGGDELSPRQKLSSAGFALRAEMAVQSAEAINAAQLGGLPASEYVLSPDLVDGDDDTLSSLTCGVDAIPKWNGSAWYCGTDESGSSDTTLSEAQVDAMVANNGYAGQSDLDTLQASLATIASTASFSDLTNVPIGLSDGDDDTVGSLSCAVGEVAQWNGSEWTCAAGGGKLPLGESTPCDGAAKGAVYFDDVTNTLRVCDGTTYRKVRLCSELCAAPESVSCGAAIEDDCGQSCGGSGTGLNLSQCTDPTLVACGNVLSDNCGNICPGSGTGLDSSECNAAVTACGSPVQDSCGNDCSETGLLCTEPGAICNGGVCAICGNGVTDPGESCDDGNTTPGDGCNASCQSEFSAFHTFTSVARQVYIFKSNSNASLDTYNNFCEENGLAWFVPKSQNDAQTLINQAYDLDAFHTWIITKNNTSAGTFGGYNVTVDGPSGSEFSSSGFSAIRKWSSSYCDPEIHGVTRCWDSDHTYDWLVCQQL